MLWQSAINGQKRRNDEMGKAAHVGVGRLFSVGGVQGRGCMNNARGQVLRYLSVCSGIEAATVAWGPLGFQAVAFSEIEPFPNAVLTHHYPDVPNVGDMTKIDGRKYRGTVDLLVGGTPCQGFSVAGKRGGLRDERSGLAMQYVKIAGEIRPKWIIWENVPGCLSTGGGKDFPAFVSALYDSGYRDISWAVLDAQYFGVPQRRRRVFLVGHLGEEGCTPKILFESESLRRHFAQSPKTQTKNSRRIGTLSANCGGLTRPAGNCNELSFCIPHDSRVRRLMPIECERLMGFPDNYTAIPGASDSARYKALGNSMAVPVMRWIGERIQKWENMYAD
ncbi:DNA cytosine methyltransferase [Bilophila wadsworthia]|uniref:DNA cytosine methyltransferase n=1 Tax=Bilophila wadsworthia TaxID=35833 RepID=UPI0035230355